PLAAPHLQPKVTVVESKPARRVVASVSKPEGSPWCNGRPTYWLAGHDNTPETPWCQREDGSWTQPGIATLDIIDARHAAMGRKRIDRHACVSLEFNGDTRLDLACVIGAGKGTGQGFNEVYVTEPDGSLRKIEQDHGLQKYPGMRTRYAVALDAADGGQLLFISTQGAPRDDGQPNAHRLFRLGAISEDDVTRPYFHEVDPNGPWVLEFRVSFVTAADINHDGITDLIVGDMDGPTRFFLQSEDMRWQSIDLGDIDGLHSKWANVRVADVTGDGIKDLIVVGPSIPARRRAPYLRLYAGNPDQALLFDFENPVYEYLPPFDAGDVSLVDANKDGISDLYLVQNDQSRGTYCALGFKSGDWWERGPQPPAEFVPPIDSAQDILLIGNENAPDYTPFRLEHALPGCGGLVEPWDNHSLIVAKGNFVQPGYNLLLEW
ncbi:MAG TPA: VCBS repeat-containing protein, partial [Kineobactrum sp.]